MSRFRAMTILLNFETPAPNKKAPCKYWFGKLRLPDQYSTLENWGCLANTAVAMGGLGGQRPPRLSGGVWGGRAAPPGNFLHFNMHYTMHYNLRYNMHYNMHTQSYACWKASFNMHIESYACYDKGYKTTIIETILPFDSGGWKSEIPTLPRCVLRAAS